MFAPSATNIISSEPYNASAQPSAGNLHLSRTPIYNAKYAPLAYEMHLHGAGGHAHQASFYFDVFTSTPPDQLLGNALAFLKCDPEEIIPDFEEIIDPKRIVIDFAAPNERTLPNFGDTIATLRARGFLVSVGEYALHADLRHLLLHVDFLKIDTRKIDLQVLKILPSRLQKAVDLKLIAAHLQSQELMQTMVEVGYYGFHGTLEAQEIKGKFKTVDSSRQNILILMKLVQQEADMDDILAALKRDPGLSFNLLRYVNSAAFVQFSETTTLNRAIQLLGHKKLYRWLGVRLMSSSNHPAQGLLLRAALTRGRMMELLADECTPSLPPDDAFITGVFSLLDKLMGVPIEEALKGVNLSPNIIEALKQDGDLGKLLITVSACELPDNEIMFTYEDDLDLVGLLPMAHINAIQWAESIIDV